MRRTVEDLVDRLRTMPAGTIREAGHIARSSHRSAADEIAWWSATLRVEDMVRRQGRRIEAATAATVAGRAVKQAALHSGMTLDDADVVAAARAAGEAAGALVAGPQAVAEASFFLDRLSPSFADSVWPLAAA